MIYISFFFVVVHISLSEQIQLSHSVRHIEMVFAFFSEPAIWEKDQEKEEEEWEAGKKHRIYDSILDLESYLVVTSWVAFIGNRPS